MNEKLSDFFPLMLTISFLLYSFAVLTEYNLNHLYNEWCHMKLTYHVLNKNVNKIDFVSPSADCSVVLWWGSLAPSLSFLVI
jgi:hypothetical protein